MKLIRTYTLSTAIAISIGASTLLSPSFAEAAQTSIYQEVITSSTAGDSAYTEISSHSVINGQTYDYYFSTTTPESIQQSVRVEDGLLTIDRITGSAAEAASSSVASSASDQTYQAWIINMMNFIHYLQLYVAQSI